MNHLRIATVAEATAAAAAAVVRALPDVEAAEVRLDRLWPSPPDEDRAADDVLALLDAASERGVGLVATLRPSRQGGAWEGPEEVRLGLLVAAARSGFGYVDLEHDLQDMGPVLQALEEAGAQVLLSDHRFPAAPSREEGLLRLLAMQDRRRHLEKAAFPCGSFADVLRTLELAHAHAARSGRPAVSPLGFGAPVRALLRLAGNRATYGHAPGSRPAASGQPGLLDVQAVWDHWGLERDWNVQGHHGWYAVLGRPVDGSLSPRIHNAALRAGGRPERFGALDVPDSAGALRLVATVARRIGLRGASVTHPHKHHAHGVAVRDGVADAVGAVNCLRFTAAGIEGTNTDARAFHRLFSAHRTATRHVGILGAGGAARAALWAARELGIDATVHSRGPSGKATADAFRADWRPWEERAAARPDTWVQATTVQDVPLLPHEALAHRPALIELVYAEGATPLQRAAEAAGCPVVSGQDFLIEQGVDAYRFWTGTEPDRAAMADAMGMGEVVH